MFIQTSNDLQYMLINVLLILKTFNYQKLCSVNEITQIQKYTNKFSEFVVILKLLYAVFVWTLIFYNNFRVVMKHLL